MNINLQKFIEKQFEQKQKLSKKLNEGEDLSEDVLNEDEASQPKPMTEEELKIESLKIATNIAKLMSDVTTDDIITIADKVSGFIRDHQIGSDDSSNTNDSTVGDELELPSDENTEENKDNNTEENKEETV